MKSEIELENKRKSQRVQSSLTLLLEACRHWAESLDNSKLLKQVVEMEFILDHLDQADCSDDSVHKLENVTMNLISNMDQFLKSLGDKGLEFKLVKH